MSGSDLSINRVSPVVDYTSQDFDAIKADLIAWAQSKYADRWTDFNEDQFAVVLLEISAYLGDLLGYHANASIREAFASTLVRRQNLLNIARILDGSLALGGAEASTVKMRLSLKTVVAGGVYPFTLTRQSTQVSNDTSEDQIFFHPKNDTVVSAYPSDGFVDVDFEEGERFENQLIGVSDGSPNQRWQFTEKDVIYNSITVKVGASTWAEVKNLILSDGNEHTYKLHQNDDGTMFAIFGDGKYGAIPPLAAEIRATYRIGGGTRGNLGPGVIDKIVSAHANVISVTNPEKSSGGKPPKTLREARNLVSGTLSTLDRAVTAADHAAIARTVSGVSKAYAVPSPSGISNRMRVYVAPGGGGQPTDALRNLVTTKFHGTRMMGRRVEVFGPTYRDLRFHSVLHINSNFRAAEVEARFRNLVLNSNGTGLLNFDQLNFAGLDEEEKLLITNTRLQDNFASLQKDGLDRVEIQKLDVVPVARIRGVGSGNTGNGTVTNIITTGRHRRRQFYILMTSSTTYSVYERIVGEVTEIASTVVTDASKVFEDEGISNFAGYLLVPDAEFTATSFVVSSVAGQNVFVSSNINLYSFTAPGRQYFIYNPTPINMNTGVQFVSADTSVKFTINVGATPFIAGDFFILDIFPVVGDIRLLSDEYPQLPEFDFITRTNGGSRI